MTVLGLIPTVWGKSSKISYLRELSAQVSQIVFLAHLTVLRFFITKWRKLQKSYISISSLHKYRKSCSELVWPFYGLLQAFEEKLQKSHISVSSVHKYHKSCSEFIWPFYDLLQMYEENLQKSSYSGSSVHKYHKSCSELIWPFYDLLTTVWGKTSKISYLCEFSAFYGFLQVWSKIKNLRSPWVQCSSMTNRVLSSFDRFTTYYNCMK